MAKKNNVIGEVLFTEEQIRKRAKELGAQITSDYEGEELVVIGTLKGSIPWFAEIIKYIDKDITIDFISASSYGSSTISSGLVKITLDTEANLYNKHVLIIEDIVDTGNTLKFMFEKFEERGPKSVKVCTMLDKPARRTNDLKADYVGFEVEDLFVIGFGLDYDQHYRNLPYVSFLTQENE